MTHSLEKFISSLEQLLFLTVSAFFALIPLFIWHPVTKFLRVVFFDLLGLRKKVVFKNLKIAFPEWTQVKRKKCAQKSFELFLLNMIEFLRCGFMPVWPGSTIENKELLESTQMQARERGTTTVGVVFHMSNWEAVGQTLWRHGFKNSTISKSAGSPFADRFLTFLRQRNGMGSMLISGAKGSVYRQILGCIADGRLIGFPMDQHRYGSPYIDFLGKPATTNESFVTIQQRQNLPVLLTYPVRTGLGKGKLVFEPFEVPVKKSTESKEEFSLRLLLEVNKRIADVVRKYPEQYFWLHNRWK